MKRTNIFQSALICGAIACTATSGAWADRPAGEKPDQPATGQAKVQLAILLDTSGSMSGLIEQAKSQLWSIVNTFIDAKQNGLVPFVEVALYEYGNDGLESESHWIRRIQPLTRDLDQISGDLFALRTNGGSEYCGAVVSRAVADLDWDPSPDVYKAIFVAGNEAFTQGPIDPSTSCRDAIAKGVIVNTIHCGDEASGVSGGWKSGAMLADGKFLIIDHNKAVVHIEAPQDAEILRLNEELNKTYVPIGVDGRKRASLQVEQDANAVRVGGNAIQSRANAKATANYHNPNWDLVDASKTESFKWDELKSEDLPKEMQTMSLDERQAYVAEKQKDRAALQKKIRSLDADRQKFVASKLKERAEGEGDTLDAVVTETVRDQAKEKGYTFK